MQSSFCNGGNSKDCGVRRDGTAVKARAQEAWAAQLMPGVVEAVVVDVDRSAVAMDAAARAAARKEAVWTVQEGALAAQLKARG